MSPVQLIPLQCIKCQNALVAQVDEVVWVCPQCGQGQQLSDEKGLVPQVVRYSAGIPQNATGKPVWVVQGEVTLHRETFGMSMFDKDGESAQFWSVPRWFFIPAYELAIDALVQSSTSLLRQPPPLQEANSPAKFLPVTIHSEDIRPLVEFVIFSIEADRKDSMKSLTYDLKLGEPDLWIVP